MPGTSAWRTRTGDLLLFTDADDVVAPGWLAALARALGRDRPRDQPDRVRPPEPALGAGDALRPAGHRAGRVVVRRGVLPLRVRGDAGHAPRVARPDRRLGRRRSAPAGEDMDYCWRLQEAGARVRFAPEALVHYRLRTSFGGLYAQGRAYGESWPLVYKKHRPLGLPPARRLSATRRRGVDPLLPARPPLPPQGPTRAARLGARRPRRHGQGLRSGPRAPALI